jgi:hypothetical protein
MLNVNEPSRLQFKKLSRRLSWRKSMLLTVALPSADILQLMYSLADRAFECQTYSCFERANRYSPAD